MNLPPYRLNSHFAPIDPYAGGFAARVAVAAEFSIIQLAAPADRPLWITNVFQFTALITIGLGVFAADQIDGAEDDAVVVQDIHGPATTAVMRVGTALADPFGTLLLDSANELLWEPVYVPAGMFFVYGDGTANTTLSATLRFIELVKGQ